VPGALDLGDHHDVEFVPDLAHERGQVIEHPRRLEAVDPRPELGLAELHLLADADQAIASGLLAIDRYRVLQVSEQDVHGRRDVGDLRDHLLVGEVQEMDHPRGLERDLQDRRGGADRERLSEVTRVSQSSSLLIDSVLNASGTGAWVWPTRHRRPQKAGTTSHAPARPAAYVTNCPLSGRNVARVLREAR